MAVDWGCPPNCGHSPRIVDAAKRLADYPNFPQAARSPDGVDNLTIPSGFFKGLDRWIQQLGQLGQLGTCSTLHVPCMYIAWHIPWPIPWNIPVSHERHPWIHEISGEFIWLISPSFKRNDWSWIMNVFHPTWDDVSHSSRIHIFWVIQFYEKVRFQLIWNDGPSWLIVLYSYTILTILVSICFLFLLGPQLTTIDNIQIWLKGPERPMPDSLAAPRPVVHAPPAAASRTPWKVDTSEGRK